jgi:hypothetical protein
LAVGQNFPPSESFYHFSFPVRLLVSQPKRKFHLNVMPTPVALAAAARLLRHA